MALEHLTGLTCDVVGGCAYVPCIQRNGIYALRAISSAEQAHLLKGQRRLVYLDDMIRIVYESGNELDEGYRETALLGLGKHCKYTLKYTTDLSVSSDDKDRQPVGDNKQPKKKTTKKKEGKK
ncbi:MAG: L-serine ammonia-lyase, iron-sulfur-dependent, subunit alpha [Mycoplasmoidaceae bacterium]|nr:L-serine ammonia-lyase, iron-sulfur-dependent, subunit alpha [Mycoplasmoidaceae bacterium]